MSTTTTLKFYAVDSVGNASSVRTETYTIDTVAPATSAIPFGGAYNSAKSITLLCTDGSGTGCTGTYYTVDGSTPTRSSTRYTAAISIPANTTLKFFSVDAAGNDESVRTETYVIDTVAPTVAAAPAGGLYLATQNVTLTCTDNASGSGCASIHYTLDGSAPTTGSATYTAPLAISADTTLKFLAVDNVGNVSTTRTEVYDFDTVAPTTSATPAGGTYRTAQSVTLACADDAGGSGCANTYYTLDGSTPTTGSPRLHRRHLPLRQHHAEVLLRGHGGQRGGRAHRDVRHRHGGAHHHGHPRGRHVHLGAERLPGLLRQQHRVRGHVLHADGSTPTTSSPRYTAAISISANTTLKFFSVDTAGNAETARTETYSFVNPGRHLGAASPPSAPSRMAPSASPWPTRSSPIRRPLTGTLPPTRRASSSRREKNGPAVFVAVDPATLSPVPKAGDRVSFTATEKATVNGMVRVTKLDSAASPCTAVGSRWSFLRNDVSNVDLVANLDDYESELISLSGTVASHLRRGRRRPRLGEHRDRWATPPSTPTSSCA